ncbi:MAG: TM1812 family CRISPR-associated protein [Eubacteriales bacterium]|nr:TM1812 family CRISPR-associated protein [Eubacteriales bacterium]
MYQYSTMQWVLFFYIYCMIGWIWESCYVSAKNRKWVNRGFMYGPFLPIYGTGAIFILLATIPVRSSLPLVFLFGSLVATLLEFVTGEAMLRMFHVRYWDYSMRFLNVRGHICLKCSVVWGAFSILMIRFLHVPIEKIVCGIPRNIEEPVTFLLTLVIASDFTMSFRNAMNFRQMLDKLSENNEELRHIMKRMEVVSAFVADDMEHLKDEFSERKEQTREMLELTQKELEEYLDESKRHGKERLEEVKQKAQEKRENIYEKMDFKTDLAELHELLDARKKQLEVQRENLKKSRMLKDVDSILKRNNVAVSTQYKEALAQIREHLK